jgi:SAM-dependent methyltransferase
MKTDKSHYDTAFHTPMIEVVNDEYFRALADFVPRFYFRPDERQKAIFEYGCGLGVAIANLPNAAGWDVGKRALEVCRQRGVRVFEDISEVPRGAWEMVFCRHVLEHVEQPLEALKLMRELLHPDGELYLVLPRERHFHVRIIPDWTQHLYCWNFRSINNLLFRAGFSPYSNETRFPLGARAFLPIRRLLGDGAYFGLIQTGRILRRNGELLVRARLG